MNMPDRRMSSTQGYIEMANELLKQLRIPKRIDRLEEIGANIFVPLYEGICGRELLEVRRPAISRADQLVNLQAVIDNLSTDVLHISLSHIRAEDILNGDRTAICNLLEIFQGLMEYLLQQMDTETSSVGEVDDLHDEDAEDDVDGPLRGADRRNGTSAAERRAANDAADRRRRRDASGENEPDGRRTPQSGSDAEEPLTTGDLVADDARRALRRVDAEADEAGVLTDAVAEAVRRRRLREAERSSELRHRIREYLAMRRNDLDLLAEDLRPRAADLAEEEWLQDYLRLARRRPPSPPALALEDTSDDEVAARRLRGLAEEHQDRVADVRARRRPAARMRVQGRPPGAGAGAGPVAAAATDGRRLADRAERAGAARRDVLRDCYDVALEAAGQGADEAVRGGRRRVSGKENAIRRVARSGEDAGPRRRRGTSGLVKPQVRVCAGPARPLPPEALSVGEPADEADADRDILAYLVDQFPYMQLSSHTLNELWYRANRQKERASATARDEARARPPTREEAAMAEAERRQRVLADILRKELGYNRRLRDRKEREAAQRELRAQERERRMQAVRAKRYYDEFALQMRAKMLRSRDREETLFRRLFKEALHTQRERINDMRKYSRDVRDRRIAREMNEIKSLENFYRDRFQILAESLKKERKEITTQDNEQTKMLRQLKKELRNRLEHDIRGIQAAVRADQEDDYFRERNAERILCDIYRGGPVDLR